MFSGQPEFVPIVGTQLLWASNTTNDVLIDLATNNYYVLLAGRWFTSASLTGPWTFVAKQRAARRFCQYSAAFARRRRAADGRGNAAGAGSGDRELDSANRHGAAKNGPEVHAELRWSAAVRADPGNAAVVCRQFVGAGDPGRAEFVLRGRRRASGSRHRESRARGSSRRRCRPSIYTIPPSSPIHYVTYVRIYEATPQCGLRRLYARLSRHGRRAVRHRRLRNRLRVLAVDRLRVVSRRRDTTASLRRRSTTRTSDSRSASRSGLATAAWTEPYWGGAYYHPGVLGRLSVLRDRRAPTSTAIGATPRIRVRARGTPAAASPARTCERQLLQPRTGTSGNIQRRARNTTLDRQRDARLRPHGQQRRRRLGQRRARQQLQHLHRPALDRERSVSARARVASTYNRAGATTAGPEGNAHVGGGSTYNAKTGKTNTWGTASVGNNHYADVNGNVYKNTGDGWQQHSSSGWSNASAATTRGRIASRRRAAPATIEVRRLLQQRGGPLRRRRRVRRG